MALVKLKRSWFSCGTILTSHISLAIDPSLCLQITSNFPLCVQLMLLPFPIITEPLIGVSSYTPVLLLVMWVVAAESPKTVISNAGKCHFIGDKSLIIFIIFAWIFMAILGFLNFFQVSMLSFLIFTTKFIIVPSAFTSLAFFSCSAMSSSVLNSICKIFHIFMVFVFRSLPFPGLSSLPDSP